MAMAFVYARKREDAVARKEACEAAVSIAVVQGHIQEVTRRNALTDAAGVLTCVFHQGRFPLCPPRVVDRGCLERARGITQGKPLRAEKFPLLPVNGCV